MDDERYRWSKEDTLKLIKLYKGFPYLWNTSLREHRDKDKRAKAILKIAKEFNITVPEVQRKLHNLRCSFNQEIRRLKNKNYFSNWEFFESMNFVAGQYKRRRSIVQNPSNIELRSFKTEEMYNAGNSGNSMEGELTDNEPVSSKTEIAEAIYMNNEYPTNNIRYLPRKCDEFETFGNFVGAELRGLTCPYKRDDLKRMILQNILTVTDIAYVSPTGNFSNSHANQNSPSLHSMLSVASMNDTATTPFGTNAEHEFHSNNVKIEI